VESTAPLDDASSPTAKSSATTSVKRSARSYTSLHRCATALLPVMLSSGGGHALSMRVIFSVQRLPKPTCMHVTAKRYPNTARKR
jgi:hypothetical protein